jgi:hypothetical protein
MLPIVYRPAAPQHRSTEERYYVVYGLTHWPPGAAFTTRCTSMTLQTPSLLMSAVQAVTPSAWLTVSRASMTLVAFNFIRRADALALIGVPGSG